MTACRFDVNTSRRLYIKASWRHGSTSHASRSLPLSPLFALDLAAAVSGPRRTRCEGLTDAELRRPGNRKGGAGREPQNFESPFLFPPNHSGRFGVPQPNHRRHEVLRCAAFGDLEKVPAGSRLLLLVLLDGCAQDDGRSEAFHEMKMPAEPAHLGMPGGRPRSGRAVARLRAKGAGGGYAVAPKRRWRGSPCEDFSTARGAYNYRSFNQ